MTDQKLTELDPIASIDGNELLYIVDDPSGVPESNKTTVDDLASYVESTLNTNPGRELLYDQTLGGTAASINVYPTGTIPATGKHIHLKISARTNKSGATAEGIKIEFNDDTGNNYSCFLVWHNFDSASNDQSQAGGGPVSFAFASAANAPANSFAAYDVDIYDYTSTSKNKTFQSRGTQRTGAANTSIFIYDAVGEWLSTSAITKIELLPADGNSFIAGTRVTAWLEK